MLASLMRRAQLLELVLCAAIGTWLVLSLEASIPAAVVTAMLLPFVGRFTTNAVTFTCAAAYKSPREPLGFAAAMRMILRELGAFLRFNMVNVPWEHRRTRPDPPLVASERAPVVLIHGYYANRGCFRVLARELDARGLGPVYTPNQRAIDASIEDYEEDLHAAIERIAEGTGRRVKLVAHSMGGLAARLYLAKRGEARVERLITIASPHHGTWMACLGEGANARQMRQGCDFLVALEAAEARVPRTIPVTSIYTAHDNMVMPQDTSRLAWAENVRLVGVGHLAILELPELRELVAARLA